MCEVKEKQYQTAETGGERRRTADGGMARKMGQSINRKKGEPAPPSAVHWLDWAWLADCQLLAHSSGPLFLLSAKGSRGVGTMGARSLPVGAVGAVRSTSNRGASH
jgi:hypothetical protein